jgi:hypothetical protein
VVTGPQRQASASEMADAFQALNRMLDSWSTQELLIWTVRIDRYTLDPPQTSYTIGPGADFNAQRPERIEAANIVLAGMSEVHVPLRILSDKEWAEKRLRVIPTSIPTQLYYDNNYPIAKIYLWGYPTAGNDLELFTWQIIPQFATQVDAVQLPPGYLDAAVYNLARRLCAQFGTVLRPDVAEAATKTLARIKGANASSPIIASADFGMKITKRGDFNYLTGLP